MISVLLTLLKIIGIVLLSLLGVFLVLLLIVLFVPVRYRFKGYYKDEFICRGKITWLLHLLSVSIDFDKELVTSVKILGINISSILNKKEDTIRKSKNKETNKTTQSDIRTPENTKELQTDIASLEQKSEERIIFPTPNDNTVHSGLASAKKSQSLYEKIKNFVINIKNKTISVYQKIVEIIQNIKEKKETLSRYIEIIKKEEVKSAFSFCKKRIFKMFKHLLPKKMKIHAHIGMDDPSTTGYILAIYSVLPEKIRRQFILKADFDEVIMEADYNIKGACNAFSLLFHLLSIITNKNCRTFYKLVKKEISNERN